MLSRPPRIRSLKLPEHGRLIAISDIHGSMEYFRGLLDKIGFSSADTLIIDGDFLEKGPACIETLHYIMSLCDGGNTHALLGNCDEWYLIFDIGQSGDVHHSEYLRRKRSGLLWEMLLSIGVDPATCESPSDYYPLLAEKYASEWSFLRNLPHAIETDRFIFVHSGLDPRKPLAAHSVSEITSRPAFLNEKSYFDKWIIVGHWPCVLYGESITCANPIIDREHHVISIDGGCVLKDDGQLNALILDDIKTDAFRFEYYDRFPRAVALDSQGASDISYYIRWGDSTVQVLDRGEEFSRCRHVRTGYEMDILTKYLFSPEPITDCNDSTDYVLPVKPGDVISVNEVTSRGILGKLNGVSGWYFGRVEYISEK